MSIGNLFCFVFFFNCKKQYFPLKEAEKEFKKILMFLVSIYIMNVLALDQLKMSKFGGKIAEYMYVLIEDENFTIRPNLHLWPVYKVFLILLVISQDVSLL